MRYMILTIGLLVGFVSNSSFASSIQTLTEGNGEFSGQTGRCYRYHGCGDPQNVIASNLTLQECRTLVSSRGYETASWRALGGSCVFITNPRPR